jgi:hypothetical protein
MCKEKSQTYHTSQRLRLELENKMLREKRLPPAANGNDKDDDSER